MRQGIVKNFLRSHFDKKEEIKDNEAIDRVQVKRGKAQVT